ncbi:SAVED domain-containing protein [Roseiconus nitratireducens]|uniref:SAVED domain-containing protein n=1 Tax=Roseiconus nitratireducens TaxID=2605748 RepID=A0A5M6CUQ7_9BACT|nr:SAVED domain-containing protein [Roseiconus nitratireducens]
MSVSNVPEPIRLCLWGRAAGRCQYEGCNRELFRDQATKAEFNQAYIAHIIADKPTGPRGDPVLSEKLKADLSNLMLLCDAHHRLIDKVDVAGHSVARLQKMKQAHESRIELVTAIDQERRSHVLMYGARIGEHGTPLTIQNAKLALLPDRYPASHEPISLSLGNASIGDDEQLYWTMEVEHLRRQFAERVKPRLTVDAVHLSVFALAPIPLLVELGRLLSDIPMADVYQLHREPSTWSWLEHNKPFEFKVLQDGNESATAVAINLALSASVTNDRVRSVLGDDCCIYTVTPTEPGNDFLKSRAQLQLFRETMRKLFDQIKLRHGESCELSVFPAIPVAAAVELGRIWMPKADLPFRVYDQNRKSGGFIRTITISQV